MNDINGHAYFVASDKDKATKQIRNILNRALQSELHGTKKELLELDTRIEKIDFTLKNLYDDKINGKIPEAFFDSMMQDSLDEKANYEEKRRQLREKVSEAQSNESAVEEWTSLIEKYLNLDVLTREITFALIDEILVSERREIDGQTMQDVQITYKFVGCLNKSNVESKKKDVA